MSPTGLEALALDGLAVLVEASVLGGGTLALGLGLARLPGAPTSRHALLGLSLASLPLAALVASTHTLHLDAPAWLAAVWLVGAAAVLGRYLAGCLALRRLTRTATPLAGAALADVPVPLTWGALRPTILLPHHAATWSAVELDATLAHERAHIARADWLVQGAATLTCAVFWFHPLAWLGRRSLLHEAELAADAVALRTTAPTTYASHLVARADELRRALVPVPSPACPVVGSRLGERVTAALAPTRPARPALTATLFVLVVSATAAASTHQVLPDPPSEPTCDTYLP